MENSFKLVILNFFLISFCNCFDVGDDCTVERTSMPGTCKTLNQCPEAKRNLIFKGILPTSCGYIGHEQVVCCENAVNLDGRFGESKILQKCKEYSKALNNRISALPLAEGAIPMITETKKCGHDKIPLIVGGTEAAAREFPHSALLGYSNPNGTIGWYCGGSLISPLYVLTAGHCTISDVVKVRLGELNLQSSEDGTKPIDVDVAEIIPYPTYTKRTKYNDIALIKLAKQVHLNEYVKPICLSEGNESYEKAIATGWGAIKTLGSHSDTLLKVTLEKFSQNECTQQFNKIGRQRQLPDGIIEKMQICAGSHNESRDTCQGDSGGPLQIYHPEVECSYSQIGITSFGVSCGSIGFPGVYTRVSNYLDWIQGIVWPNDDSP